MTKKIAPKPKEAAAGGGGGDRVVVKQAQIEAASLIKVTYADVC